MPVGAVQCLVVPVLLPLLGPAHARSLACANRACHSGLSTCTAAWAQNKWRLLQKRYHPRIIELTGGMHAMMPLPELGWRGRFLGSTEYLDRLMPGDMTHRVTLGYDETNLRPFVAFRLFDDENGQSVEVLFQRFRGIMGTWTNALCDGSGFVCESGYFMREGVLQHDLLAFNICNLLEDRGSAVLRYAYPWSNELVTVPCRLC
jgi:hypothetical protein